MKKKFIAAIALAAAFSGFFGTGIANASTALGGHYATNPDNGVGKNKTITIDGDFSDWSEDMMVAKGVANDDPRIFRGSHEGPVYDTYALYSAWDDENLYLMWQYTNVTDVVDPSQQYPISDNGKPYNGDIPIMLALNTGKDNKTNGTATNGKKVWGLNVNFTTDVDTVLCFSAKPGVGQPAIFTANADGELDYDTAVGFKKAGVSYAYGDGFLGSKMDGIKANGYQGYVPADLLKDSSNWVNFLNEGHSTSQDTMYEMKIPLSALGIDKNYLETNGVGAMLISTFGASGIASLPMDMTFVDNASEPYSADDSTSAEKEDMDDVTVPLAKIGTKSEPQVIRPSISSLTADKVSPQYEGTSINFATSAASANGGLTYQYEINDKVVRDFDDNADYTWTPSKAGTYKVKVTVKDAANMTAVKYMTYEVTKSEGIKITGINSDLQSPQAAGTTVKLTTQASFNGALQYKYWAYDEDGNWTAINDYSEANSVDWTPAKSGNYMIWVDVKDSNGNVQSSTMNYVVTAKPDYIEENDSRIVYLGTWNNAENIDYSNGQMVYTDAIGSKATLNFYGTGIKLLSTLGTDRGIAKITIDGKVYSADMYRSSIMNKQTAFEKAGLEKGNHVITIECSGLSSRKATGTVISIDSIGIMD